MLQARSVRLFFLLILLQMPLYLGAQVLVKAPETSKITLGSKEFEATLALYQYYKAQIKVYALQFNESDQKDTQAVFAQSKFTSKGLELEQINIKVAKAALRIILREKKYPNILFEFSDKALTPIPFIKGWLARYEDFRKKGLKGLDLIPAAFPLVE